jgi:arylsulfatase A-like enzyme
MKRRDFLKTSALGAAGAMLSGGVYAEARADNRPNILFIFVDDQRNDKIGCTGDPIAKTPHIDAFAEKGTIFENAFVTTSICAASRASVLTGLTERTHGYTFGKPPVPAPFTRTSYPALLRKAGYRTGFIGKFGCKMEEREAAGLFDVFESRDRPYLRKQKDGSIRHIDDINMEQAIDFVESCKPDQPFCLSVSFSSCHAEDSDKENHYPPIDAVKDLYSDVTFPDPELGDPEIFEKQPAFLQESLNRERYFWRWDTPEKYQKNMRGYYRLISGVDYMIGRIQSTLEKQGLAENTVIIYAGDNGYYMANRGFAGKWSHYEESLRIPLIVYDPRRPLHRRAPEMALNIDIPATMLELAGVAVPGHYQGRGLLALVRGDDSGDWREDFFAEHRMEHEKIPKWEGVRAQRYVYACYDGQEPPCEFLHDLEKDPDQLQNFAGDPEYAAVLDKMRKRCAELRERYLSARPENQ